MKLRPVDMMRRQCNLPQVPRPLNKLHLIPVLLDHGVEVLNEMCVKLRAMGVFSVKIN
jgi:hypothetical protein